jgi:3-hydroxymyristoyl/3-hydroxydecanoyl-(acyl carrier protein) dehydratase
MLATKTTVTKLIPQEPPMVMVDSLLAHKGSKTLTGFSIEEGNIFVSGGVFSEAGIIENMAQSAALRIGWIAMLENTTEGDFKPPIGVIGSVKNYKLYRLPIVNSKLETEIRVQTEIFNATMIKAMVTTDGDLLAEAELKIFITREVEQA